MLSIHYANALFSYLSILMCSSLVNHCSNDHFPHLTQSVLVKKTRFQNFKLLKNLLKYFSLIEFSLFNFLRWNLQAAQAAAALAAANGINLNKDISGLDGASGLATRNINGNATIAPPFNNIGAPTEPHATGGPRVSELHRF